MEPAVRSRYLPKTSIKGHSQPHAIVLTGALLGCVCLLESVHAQETTRPIILAHYMPWYEAKPAGNRWGWHWTMDHFDPAQRTQGRREVASKYYPLIGPYDSGDADVLEFHLLTMHVAGIDGVIVDWYGLTGFRDYGLLHRNTTSVLQMCERLRMKFVICYEDQTVPALVAGSRLASADRVSHATKEINWLSKHWFRSPSYVRFNKRPVLLSFGHAGLNDDEWRQCLERLDVPVRYYSQDYRRPGATGGFAWPVPQQGLEHTRRFLERSSEWPDAIPVAYPRFDDVYAQGKVNDGYPEIPDGEGETFRWTLDQALRANPRIIQIATWNDWGEGTQIEPSLEFGYRDLAHLRSRLSNQGVTSNVALQLPLWLYRYRKSAGGDLAIANAIADQIRNEELENARDRLSELGFAGTKKQEPRIPPQPNNQFQP